MTHLYRRYVFKPFCASFSNSIKSTFIGEDYDLKRPHTVCFYFPSSYFPFPKIKNWILLCANSGDSLSCPFVLHTNTFHHLSFLYPTLLYPNYINTKLETPLLKGFLLVEYFYFITRCDRNERRFQKAAH